MKISKQIIKIEKLMASRRYKNIYKTVVGKKNALLSGKDGTDGKR